MVPTHNLIWIMPAEGSIEMMNLDPVVWDEGFFVYLRARSGLKHERRGRDESKYCQEKFYQRFQMDGHLVDISNGNDRVHTRFRYGS